MISSDGTVKIMDFGIALMGNQNSLTMTGAFVGSPSYISPEQARSETLTEKTDIFSTGAVIYECATGGNPFEADSIHGTINAVTTIDPPLTFEKNDEVLSAVSTIIHACLEKNVDLRPDAKNVCKSIALAGKKLHINLGKSRLKTFCLHSNTYRTIEHSELFPALRRQGRADIKGGNISGAVRHFSEANRFGELSMPEMQLISGVSSIKLAFKIGTVIFLGLTTVFLIIAGSRHISKARLLKRRVESTTQIIQSEVTSPSSSDAESVFVEPLPPITTKEPIQSVTQSAVSSVRSAKGFLRIKTNPPWTRIYLDGTYAGTFPRISLIPVTSGSHSLSLTNDRCSDYSETFTIASGDTILKEVILTPHPTAQ